MLEGNIQWDPDMLAGKYKCHDIFKILVVKLYTYITTDKGVLWILVPSGVHVTGPTKSESSLLNRGSVELHPQQI